MEKICTQFSSQFYIEGDVLGYTDIATHKLPFHKQSQTINIRPYRLPESHKTEVNKQVQEMLKNNIITPSVSPWNSPLLVVPKKADSLGNKKWRVVVDFRKLNELTVGDAFPIPNITDIIDQTGQTVYFSSIDLASGYHQIAMDTLDRDKTAFSTPTGHYEFLRMPFGLKGAPATF